MTNTLRYFGLTQGPGHVRRGYAKRDRPRDTITRGNRTWEWGTGVWKIRLVGC